MLIDLLIAQYGRFAALAEAWIAAGTTTFGAGNNEFQLAALPSGALHHTSGVAMPHLNDRAVGEPRVVGSEDTESQSQLLFQAGSVGNLAGLVEALRDMTAELVDSRDRLLALSEFTQAMRGHATVEQMLATMVSGTIRLTKAEGSFAVLVPSTGAPVLVNHAEPYLDETTIWGLFWR